MISKVQRQLLDVLAAQLFGKPRDKTQKTDWQTLMKEAKKQSVFSLVYCGVKEEMKTEVSPEQMGQYELLNIKILASNLRNFYQHGEIHQLLTENGVPYVVLKGIASASYYPDPMLRAMGDVDFLVDPSHIQEVDALLQREGYEKEAEAEASDFHWAYQRKKQIVEMHWSLHGIPKTDSQVILDALRDLIQQGKLCTVSGAEYCAPTPFHHGLILLLHTIGHLTSGGIGLRHLCDWLVFENSLSETEFHTLFEKPLRQMGLWTFAKALTDLGARYLGCEKREWCGGVDERISDQLLDDFFECGNFGQKSTLRRGQTQILRDEASGRVSEKSFLLIGLSNITTKARKNYPVCRKYPILLPACWIATVLCYFKHILSGRSANVLRRSVLRDVKKRQALYLKLKLFKPD